MSASFKQRSNKPSLHHEGFTRHLANKTKLVLFLLWIRNRNCRLRNGDVTGEWQWQRKVVQYVCITTNQPDTKSDPNPTLTISLYY